MVRFLRVLSIGLGILGSAVCASSQDVGSLLANARKLMSEYSYEEASSFYEQAESMVSDSLTIKQIEKEKALCDSALVQMREVPVLKVVSRARFSKDDFYLYYPLPDNSFRPVEGGDVIFYNGTEDHIYLNREEGRKFVATFGDKLYFSSNTLGGYGGYDLFCCDWDEKLGEWKEPYNMGFPYSSAGDDFLFIETEDGRFDLFASNRSCSADSVYVYVIDKSATADVTTITSAEQRRELAQLAPNTNNSSIVTSTVSEVDPWSEKYQSIVEREREILSQMRTASEEERLSLENELAALAEAKKQVEEYIFRNNTQTRNIIEEVDREVVGVEGSFIFLKKNLGKPIKITYSE